jgi:hypothetical protein
MARVDLGLTDVEYGRMHPARFAALRARLDLRERRADARAAMIAVALAGAEVSIEDVIVDLRALGEREPPPSVPPAPEPDETPPARRPTIISVPDDPFFAPLVNPEREGPE